MTTTVRTTRTALLAATLASALLSLPQVSLAAASGSGAAAQAQAGDQAASDAASHLNKKQYKNVTVSVENGIATLSGTVDLYEYKVDADKAAHKAKGVTGVRNMIRELFGQEPPKALPVDPQFKTIVLEETARLKDRNT